ncbi:uncharacterized protein LOC142233833 [Haematobia irritans]|uniref:uncharacterized protein LOC142233833 n=1 Tax=Haematobia irritans TaxID=7368 RepID=UPI003F50C883
MMMSHRLGARIFVIKNELLKFLLFFWLLMNVQWCCGHALAQQQSNVPERGLHRVSSPSLIKVNHWLLPGQELVFSTIESNQQNNGLTSSTPSSSVIVNNVPVNPTIVPFIPMATTSTPEFLECIRLCPTTSEYNPICASNRVVYGNEQKFNCAQSCGADIRIVRRGTCTGLL